MAKAEIENVNKFIKKTNGDVVLFTDRISVFVNLNKTVNFNFLVNSGKHETNEIPSESVNKAISNLERNLWGIYGNFI